MFEESEPRPLPMPADPSLPVFVYGFLKPSELAFSLIHEFVERAAADSIRGAIWVRDALPLLDPDEASTTAGCLIFAKDAKAFYEVLCRFEPRKHYRWGITQTLDRGITANVLFGIRPRLAGAERLNEAEFRSRDDVVLTYGLESARIALRDASMRYGEENYFFQIQMAYMLLWSVVERFANLKHGPWLEPNAKLKKLAADADWQSAVRRLTTQEDAIVFDSRDPRQSVKFDTNRPDRVLEYFYRIRSNISHRGKGALRDGDRVLEAAWTLVQCLHDVWQANGLSWTADDELPGAFKDRYR